MIICVNLVAVDYYKMESGWLPVWVRLTNQMLEMWSDEQEADGGPAMMTVTINKVPTNDY
jgi:hypothetical protein